MSNQASFLLEKHGKFAIQNTELYTPAANEVVIKVIAAAINPVDWKITDYGIFVTSYPCILGSDVAGVVESIGSDVSNVKKGDRVLALCAGLVSGAKYGGFQRYVPVYSHCVTKIPDAIGFDEASAIPLAIATAAVGFFEPDGLQLERPSSKPAMPKERKQTLLVWGGASSVGVMAIQLANHAGYHVITTASKHNHDYLTSLGASKNFDYHDSDVVEQIKKEGKIQVIYDAISENGSIEKCMQVLQPHGGKMVAVLPVNATVPDNVKVYQCFGGSVHKTSVALGKWLFNDFLKEALIQETIVTAPPVKVAKGGLRGVPDALAMQKKGVSATKIIIHPCEDGCT